MPREREKTSRKIKAVDYKINGNRIRAYYDSAHELIFVLDETINADKPNVLLVIDSFDERKWDDVLVNDYGIDLETVRPKKDNKYQKLDIEYGGLDVYAELFQAYESDEDLDDALDNLKRFRIMAVRRSAKERLAAAEDTANKARETIERTEDTISELRARLKELKAKLSEQKRNIGREPTKTSAAKILKTEAQIDATNEKLVRAKKRLTNAQRRLATAEDDAEIARAILARHADVKPVRRAKTVSVAKRRTPVVQEEVEEEEAEEEPESETDDYEEDEEGTGEDDLYSEDYSDSETYEAKADEVADEEEVKPLFDTDPEVLDDNIAFKPIDFHADEEDEHVVEHGVPEVATVPLSFTPPADSGETTETTTTTTEYETTEENNNATPMLDSLTPVEQNTTTTEQTTTTTTEQVDVTTTVEPASFEVETTVTEPAQETKPTTIVEIEPIAPAEPVAPVRPVSPISENTVIETEVHYTKKPTFLYYLMLILLIALSIFTLWLYQRKNGAVVPDLGALTSKSEETTTVTEETNIPSPFVATTTVEETEVTNTETEAVVAEPEVVVEPEPVVVAEPEPEPIVETTPVDVPAEPVEVVAEEPLVPFRSVATYEPEKKPIPSEEEILARKPGYNVSQQEKMFVAEEPEYEPEPVMVEPLQRVETVVDESSFNSLYSMDTDVQPMPVDEGWAPEIVASELHEVVYNDAEQSDEVTCANGVPADENGCCPGEELAVTEEGFMCCVDGECFPPLY